MRLTQYHISVLHREDDEAEEIFQQLTARLGKLRKHGALKTSCEQLTFGVDHQGPGYIVMEDGGKFRWPPPLFEGGVVDEPAPKLKRLPFNIGEVSSGFVKAMFKDHSYSQEAIKALLAAEKEGRARKSVIALLERQVG